MGPAVTGQPAASQPGASQPGEIRSPARDVVLAPGRLRQRLTVASRSARPIRVSSHYPFWRANRRLDFDRAAATGYRLDIPAGASVRWAPGEVTEVGLVALGGTSGPAGAADPAVHPAADPAVHPAADPAVRPAADPAVRPAAARPDQR
jgi:urease beta subunit